MTPATLRAFREELLLIKEAGFLTNVGTRIGHLAKATPRFLSNQVDNTGKAISAYSRPVQSLKSGTKAFVSDFKGSGLPMKAVMGYGAYAGVKEVGAKQDPTGQGRSKTHRALTFAGDQAGNLIGTPFGLAGGITAGMIGRKIGDTAGKVVDKVRGYKPQIPAAQPNSTVGAQPLRRPTPAQGT